MAHICDIKPEEVRCELGADPQGLGDQIPIARGDMSFDVVCFQFHSAEFWAASLPC